MKSSLLILIASAFLLGGCASTTTSNKNRGAGMGAVVGALLGKATGDNDKSRYVWGAAVGALTGAAIGHYMDEQEAAFREELADSGVDVYREGDNLRLYIPGNVTFATGSAAIMPDFYPVLDDVAKVVNRYEKTVLVIEGHTDSVGRAEYNQQLSEHRAQSVKTWLQQANVDSRRMQAQGWGEHQPLVSNDNEANRSKNRRVELKIAPLQAQRRG